MWISTTILRRNFMKKMNIIPITLLCAFLSSCTYPSKTENPYGLVEGIYKLKSCTKEDNDVFSEKTYFEFKYLQQEDPENEIAGLSKGQWRCNLIVQERKDGKIVNTTVDYNNYVIEWHNSLLSQSDPTSIGGSTVNGHMGPTSLLYNVSYDSGEDYISVWLGIETTDKSNDLNKRRVTISYNKVAGSAVFENY